MDQYPTKANGSAYEKEEQRLGVPLDYVADKLGNAILELSALAQRQPDLSKDLYLTMRYQLIAFLALNNMLAAANDPDLTDRMLSLSRDEAERWVNLVHRQGDVSGIS